MTIKLKVAFSLDGIIIRWMKHPLQEYEYFINMINAQYGQIVI